VAAAVASEEVWAVDLTPELPPREVLEELDVAAGVLDALERLDVRFHVDLDPDRQPYVHARDRRSGEGWRVDPAALLDLLSGDDVAFDEARAVRP
jgi:hypothetical protein